MFAGKLFCTFTPNQEKNLFLLLRWINVFLVPPWDTKIIRRIDHVAGKSLNIASIEKNVCIEWVAHLDVWKSCAKFEPETKNTVPNIKLLSSEPHMTTHSKVVEYICRNNLSIQKLYECNKQVIIICLETWRCENVRCVIIKLVRVHFFSCLLGQSFTPRMMPSRLGTRVL